ncbi:type II toxin-antitoxin system PemK/MazF family toxin [Ancylobacter sp. SL191]|uniref:type II toxin-antitoxin system PemK/MazF family toxin n=1 Tax=Ancylobacter sp. SL191 TaxID=2995166 RepID=UPI00226EC96D|nr:type II toxin-antitoxin system PemK/MazF family toxin [Ancylobacter sp. SL191]WAC29242.1 type II toxin-antitoxin system PemK/MazF family toxin [Ancylobacter sp. SL191]
MGIQYHPRIRTILLCDYEMGGFCEPEMVKRRPAVVISPQLPRRPNLCAVVPLSTTPPEHDVPYVVALELPFALPAPFDQTTCWAKCDMVAAVALRRLDLFRTGRDVSGKRKYQEFRLPGGDFERIRQGVLRGLGFVNLTLTDE